MNREKILSILSETIENDINEIPTDKSLSDFGLSSIRFIQFIVAVEEEFNIEIYDSDLLLPKFETIEMIFTTLQKYFTSQPIKKVLICDCDNVLWCGIAGEEEIYLNDKNIEFQNELIELYNKGILICLCSRNEHVNLKYLDMPLTNEHITISKTNSIDKATNIKAIADELNLSLDSFVFVDDSDYEIGLINSLLPEVETVKVDYVDNIQYYFGTQQSGFNRTKLYKEQKEREKEKLHFNSVDEYNNSLQTELICSVATSEYAERIAELSQRTNQFNLSGTRYTADDVTNLINNDEYIITFLSASDKYGDMGIVGAAIVKSAVIESFYLSCRVFGRGFEFVLLDTVKSMYNGNQMYGVYNPNEKNQRYANFYTDNGVNCYA